MGHLLRFPSGGAPRRNLAPQETSAQILFFTGVRYERAQEEPKPRTRKRRAQKGRRRA